MKGLYWNAKERRALEAELELTQNTGVFRRVLALLEIDQGRTIEEVAQALRVDRSSVYRWIERYAQAGKPEALERKPGQGRPPKWNESLEELLQRTLAEPPMKIGYPANGWTLPLLQAFLSISYPGQELSTSTLRRYLRRMGYVWKRFRHTLAPDSEAEKKTPDFTPDQGFARKHRVVGPR
jgi:transposase